MSGQDEEGLMGEAPVRKALVDRPMILMLPHKVLASLGCLTALFVLALQMWWFSVVAVALYVAAAAAYARDAYCIEIWLQNLGRGRFEP